MAKAAPTFLDEHDVPMFYADQPASLALGPTVSRLTFGVEDSGEYPRPIVTLAIPTVALLLLVKDLSSTFDSEDFKKDMAKGIERSAKAFAAGTAADVISKFVKTETGRRPRALPKPKE
jgi:hypothetical protein